MNSTSIRQEINVYLDQLSPDYLKIAKEMLSRLSEKESEDATEELLNTPQFLEMFERGKKQIQAGEVTSLQQLKRKY